jgi:hypothetical protein
MFVLVFVCQYPFVYKARQAGLDFDMRRERRKTKSVKGEICQNQQIQHTLNIAKVTAQARSTSLA